MNPFATIEDFIHRGYTVGDYEDFIKARLAEASNTLRTESGTRGRDLDARIVREPYLLESIKDVVCKVANQALQNKMSGDIMAGTDLEGVKSISTSIGAGGYSESKNISYQDTSKVSAFISRADLQLLGISSQQIGGGKCR